MELAGISPFGAKCRGAPALSRKPRGCREYGKAAGGADGQNAHVRFLDGFVPASFLSGQQGHHAGKQDIPQADVPVGGQIMQPAHHQRTCSGQRIAYRLCKAGKPGGIHSVFGTEAHKRQSHAEGAAVGEAQDDGGSDLRRGCGGGHQGGDADDIEDGAQQQPTALIPAFTGQGGHQQRGGQADHLIQGGDHPGGLAGHAGGLQNGGQPADDRIEDKGIDAEIQGDAPGQPTFPDGLRIGCGFGRAGGAQPKGNIFAPDKTCNNYRDAPDHQRAVPAQAGGGKRDIERQTDGGSRHHGHGEVGRDLPHSGGIFRFNHSGEQHIADGGADTDDGSTEEQSKDACGAPKHGAQQDKAQPDKDSSALPQAAADAAGKRTDHGKGDKRQGGKQPGSAAGKAQAFGDLREKGAHAGNDDAQTEGHQDDAEHHSAARGGNGIGFNFRNDPSFFTYFYCSGIASRSY